VLVALHWGGDPALRDSLVAVAILFSVAVWNARATIPLLPQRAREQGIFIGSTAVVAASVAVFVGGVYMSGRFATSETDLAGRMEHWRQGISLLHGPSQWLFGKGLGRFPAAYFFGVPHTAYTGSYRLERQASNDFLALSGPRYPMDFGELFRLSQRMPPRPGMYAVMLDARAPEEAALHVEMCEKHLLYAAGCAIRGIVVKPGAQWQHFVIQLDAKGLSKGASYAPRLAFFSLAVGSNGRLIDIDNVSITGPDGQNIIANGDFTEGMSHWFFTSDRSHLPWHIKNLFLNVLFDQGAVGLVLFLLLVTGAIFRVAQGSGRFHPLAPYIAASLVGFLVVGAFDSLLDVPRVGFLFYLILLLALMVRRAGQQTNSGAATAHNSASERNNSSTKRSRVNAPRLSSHRRTDTSS
jgi:hypothetical protein